MTQYATIDASNNPVINVVFTGNTPTNESFNQYLEDLKQIYEQQTTVAIIFDATNAIVPGLYYQKMQANWLKDNKELMATYCVGTAYIIPNLIIRNVLKAIFTFQKQPVAYLVCKNIDEAKTWINKQLQSNN